MNVDMNVNMNADMNVDMNVYIYIIYIFENMNQILFRKEVCLAHRTSK